MFNCILPTYIYFKPFRKNIFIKNVASASISGSTMYDYQNSINEQIKTKFKGFDTLLVVTSKRGYSGKIYLRANERTKESEYQQPIKYFRSFASHMVLETSL